MIQVHGKTILSMEFNPILKAHGSSPWQLLIKAHGKSHGDYLCFTNIQVIIQDLHPRNGELCKRTFLIHHGSCQLLLHHYSTNFYCYMGNLCWKMFSWRIKEHSCCPPQVRIRSKSYLNPSSNSIGLFQTNYCCIFTSHNLPSCCKGLKHYYTSKSLAPLESNLMNMSTPPSLLLLIMI